MSSFKKRLTKTNLKWLVTFVMIALLSLATIFAFVKIDKNETTKTLGSNAFTYSIGIIAEDGEIKQGTSSIYMKNLNEVDGLKVELEEDATVTYSIFFYNAEENLVDKKVDLTSNFDSSEIPADAEFFRILVTPINDAEVSIFELNGYVSQLTVTINK